MGWTQALAIAGAEGAVLGLLALVLFQAHRRVGIIPFLAFFALLAAAVPATVHQVVLDGGPLGSLPHVLASVAPVVLALAILTHLIRGWRNAQLAAASVVLATLLTAIVTVAAHRVDLFVPGSMLADGPTTPLVAGAGLWIGTLAASCTVWGLYRISARCPTFGAVMAGGVVGLATQGGVLVGLAHIGVAIPGTTTLGALLLPLAVGLPTLVIVGVFASIQLAGIWAETRRALISRQPLGTDSRLEEAHELQQQYEQAKQARRQEADTYRQLVESDERGAYVCSPEGRVTYANEALKQILEQPDRDLVGENIRHVLGGSDARDRPQFEDYPIQVGTHRDTVQLPNGHTRAIEVTVRPTGDDQLYGRVRDRTEEVLRARVEKQKERAEFYVDLLRHDIGNYVMSPLNYLTVLQRRDDVPEEAQAYVDKSLQAVDDIADLLGRIDVLSDVDEIEPEPIDAGEILRSVAERVHARHDGALDMSLDLPSEPVVVTGSPLLEEVFSNLLGNAIRHAGQDARIELAARRDGDEWILSVADDGPGVPDDEKMEVFDRTKRNDASGGKGLGLYIVKTITSALGGDVWVDDRVPGEPEQGARFNARLKAIDPRHLPSASEGVGSEGDLGRAVG